LKAHGGLVQPLIACTPLQHIALQVSFTEMSWSAPADLT
jgi:hypothetical protein